VRPFRSADEWLGDLSADIAGMLIAAAADIAIILDRNGVILDLAFGETDFRIEGFEDWPGLLWTDVVSPDSRAKVEAMIADVAQDAATRWRQINHLDGNHYVPVQYVAMRLPRDGRFVAIGRDMRSVALLQQQLIRAQQAMERDYERLRHAETRYRMLFQIASEAVLVVNARTRLVTEANAAAGALYGSDVRALIGKRFPFGFDDAGAAAMGDLLDQVRIGARTEDVQVRLSNGGGRLFVTATLFSQDDSSYFLIRLRRADEVPDGAIVPRTKSRVIEVIEKLPDAFVITDDAGRIVATNRAFLSQVRLANEQQALGQSLERWLSQPGLGLSGLLANLRQQRTVRLFTTSLRDELDETAEVEISAVAVPHQDEPCFGFVIRDITRRLAPAPVNNGDLRGAVKHMTELVGQVSLKEIVRETTEVIERLCIEAALDLTGDNRASAAEMLGLSRQSLYVKMRRFGVGDQDAEPRH